MIAVLTALGLAALAILTAILAVRLAWPAIDAWAKRECDRLTERAIGPQRATETPIHDRLAAEYRRAS